MYKKFVGLVQDLYGTTDLIPLHEPRFIGNEKKNLLDTIDTSFVSSVGQYVDTFERKVSCYTGAKYAVATVNGTAALHVALRLSGVKPGDCVITQSLTFIATCNAIRYCDAVPILIDVDRNTLGMSPTSLGAFLEEYCEIRDDGFCWNKSSNRVIRTCVPMHTFGMPVQLDEIRQLCDEYNIVMVEDAAESLGSKYKQRHVGTFGKLAAISFNGNKIITTGGGGMILTDDEEIAVRAKHITTTAKVPHEWSFVHDETGFNYRLPNLNAALGVAQMELLATFVDRKRELANQYQNWGKENGLHFVKEGNHSESNYWLNTLITDNGEETRELLEYNNKRKVTTRPVWTPMHRLTVNQECQIGEMKNTEWLADRLVSVPSSVVVDG